MKKQVLLIAVVAVSLLGARSALSQCPHGDGACPPSPGCMPGMAMPGMEMPGMEMPGMPGMPWAPEAMKGKGGGMKQMMRAMKFVYNDAFRQSLEAKMTPADKQTIESTVAQVKTELKGMREQRATIENAVESWDTATMHQAMQGMRPTFERLGADRKIILDILAKYKGMKEAGSQSLDPVYPNPVHIGGTPAQVTYRLKNDGPVHITITDASGHAVQEISNSNETAGEHTITIGQGIAKPGAYYINIEADGAKTTQKVAAVE